MFVFLFWFFVCLSLRQRGPARDCKCEHFPQIFANFTRPDTKKPAYRLAHTTAKHCPEPPFMPLLAVLLSSVISVQENKILFLEKKGCFFSHPASLPSPPLPSPPPVVLKVDNGFWTYRWMWWAKTGETDCNTAMITPWKLHEATVVILRPAILRLPDTGEDFRPVPVDRRAFYRC